LSLQIKISRDELAQRKLFLATPMYGGNATGIFVRSAMDLAVTMNTWGVQLQLYFLFNESLITRARNYCADEFLRSDCTHMMFIDADIGFNPQDVMAMLALMGDDNPDYDVLTGPYPKKCISWEKIVQAVNKGVGDKNPNDLDKYVGDYVFNPKGTSGKIPLNQPVEVLEAGTGFMMIKRAAFEKFKAKFPQNSYRPDHARTAHFDGSREIHAYFMDPIDRTNFEAIYREALEKIDQGADPVEAAKEALAVQETRSKRLLSEDYYFCQALQEAGGKVWLCPWMKLQHAGTYVFAGSLSDLAAIGAHATVDAGEIQKIRARA
jgi:hypothetical protein